MEDTLTLGIVSTIGALDDALARMFTTSSSATLTMYRQPGPVVANDGAAVPRSARLATMNLSMIGSFDVSRALLRSA